LSYILQIWYAALYGGCRAGAQKISPKSGRGLGHVTPTIFGSTVGYPSDSLASCSFHCHSDSDQGGQLNYLTD